MWLRPEPSPLAIRASAEVNNSESEDLWQSATGAVVNGGRWLRPIERRSEKLVPKPSQIERSQQQCQAGAALMSCSPGLIVLIPGNPAEGTRKIKICRAGRSGRRRRIGSPIRFRHSVLTAACLPVTKLRAVGWFAIRGVTVWWRPNCCRPRLLFGGTLGPSPLGSPRLAPIAVGRRLPGGFAPPCLSDEGLTPSEKIELPHKKNLSLPLKPNPVFIIFQSPPQGGSGA
jgi:hypothetical protein